MTDGYVIMRHKCGYQIRVTENAIKLLYCHNCETSKGWKKVLE